MKRLTIISIVLLAFTFNVNGQNPLPPFHAQHNFLLASPGAFKFGLYGYDNPALLTYVQQPDFYFTWSDEVGNWNDFYRWGFFAGFPNFGFGVVQHETTFGSITDYRISSAFGNRHASVGIGYGWSGGDVDIFQRERLISIGTLLRPSRYVSIGAAGYSTIRRNYNEAVVDLALRPLGDEKLTIFGDFALRNDQSLKDGMWSVGAVVEALPGVRIAGRYFETQSFTVGFEFSLGRIGLSTQSVYDKDRNHVHNTYGIRLGAFDRNIIDSYFKKKKNYLSLNMYGPVRYQRFRIMDRSNTLIDMMQSIEEAKQDPSISGIAINMSGMRASRAMFWELRSKLVDFKQSDKHVVIYIDRGGMNEFHLASVADLIIMDPIGSLVLEGYLMGSTYLKGMFEKIGVGVEEWRFFEYKSAFEILAQEGMSDPDREQRQKLLDDFYRLVRDDITTSRGINYDEFDHLINNVVFFMPKDAVEYGLVDTLGRWDDVKDIIENLEGKKKGLIHAGKLAARNLPIDNHWGEPPQIAVIYALGVCAMDEGITARKLVKDVKRATKDDNVKAIVFRVDSPGGDGLASDIVAEALRKAKEKKPVIVSQGAVAASGGYWLSMYGDTIVAPPNTITGSIGVIGGWFYNTGLKERLGFTTDYVKVGDHADLGFGMTLPLVNIPLPDRNLTEEEFKIVENLFHEWYDEFVGKVADGRDMTTDEIRTIAEGRVWSGYDALELGLVDVLGGLDDAIRIAKDKAGIPYDKVVTIVELPKPELFDVSRFMPRLFGVEVKEKDPVTEHILFRLRHNGLPLPILPMDMMEEYIRANKNIE